MSATEQLTRQLADAEFAAALKVIVTAGRTWSRARQLAEAVESFVTDLDGMSNLLYVEDAAAALVAQLDNCYAPPEQLNVYARAA